MTKLRYILCLGTLTLFGCQNGPSEKPKVDNDTYTLSNDITTKSYILSTNGAVSQVDKNDIKKLSVTFKEKNIQKITITSMLSLNQKENQDVVSDIKEEFIKNGVKAHIIDILPSDIIPRHISPKYRDKYNVKIDAYSYVIKLPTAKTWKHSIGDVDVEKDMPNFGVATEYNYGNMIANARDLTDPAELAKQDGRSAVLAVRKLYPTNQANQQGGTNVAATNIDPSSSSGSSSGMSAFK